MINKITVENSIPTTKTVGVWICK